MSLKFLHIYLGSRLLRSRYSYYYFYDSNWSRGLGRLTVPSLAGVRLDRWRNPEHRASLGFERGFRNTEDSDCKRKWFGPD